MSVTDHSLSITEVSGELDLVQKAALTLSALGVLMLLMGAGNSAVPVGATWLAIALVLIGAGGVLYTHRTYSNRPAGIKNDGVWQSGLSARGAVAWITGIILTGFYILLYFYPEHLGLGKDGATNSGIVAIFDPLSRMLNGNAASEWFVYGTLYTLAILVMGYKFIWKYRHNKYQIVRTISVMFFQLGFAFLIPEILQRLSYPYYNFANMWPLNYYFFDEWNIKGFIEAGGFGLFMLLVPGLVLIVAPTVFVYLATATAK